MWEKIETATSGKQYLVRGGIGKVVDMRYDAEGFLKARILVTQNNSGTITRWAITMTIESEETAATVSRALADGDSIEWRGQWWPNPTAPETTPINELVLTEQCDAYLISARVVTVKPISRKGRRHLSAV